MRLFLNKVPDKYLKRLSEPDKGRIKNVLNGLKKEPPQGDITPIIGQPGFFRVRVGNYRILYKIENGIIFVTHITSRGQAYNKKNRRKK